jgi:hypothetical protein
MKEKRAFPRIDSDWPLFLESKEGRAKIGYIKNISLSGALIFFTDEYSLDSEKHRFTLLVKNDQLTPSEIILTGLREWTHVEKKTIMLGLVLEKLEKEQRVAFVRFLSRSDRLHVEAFLVER